HFPSHDIWQDREAVGLSVRMALRLANCLAGGLPCHHAWIASREIGVDPAPEADHTHDASHIHTGDCLVMDCAVDQDIRLALGWTQRWKVIRAYPRLHSRRDTTAGQIGAKRALVGEF